MLYNAKWMACIAKQKEGMKVAVSVKSSSKHQIAVPAAVRKRLGLPPGDRLLVRVQGNHVVLVPEPKDYVAYLSSCHLYGKSPLCRKKVRDRFPAGDLTCIATGGDYLARENIKKIPPRGIFLMFFASWGVGEASSGAGRTGEQRSKARRRG